MINGESTFPVGNVLKIFGSEEVGGGGGGGEIHVQCINDVFC